MQYKIEADKNGKIDINIESLKNLKKKISKEDFRGLYDLNLYDKTIHNKISVFSKESSLPYTQESEIAIVGDIKDGIFSDEEKKHREECMKVMIGACDSSKSNQLGLISPATRTASIQIASNVHNLNGYTEDNTTPVNLDPLKASYVEFMQNNELKELISNELLAETEILLKSTYFELNRELVYNSNFETPDSYFLSYKNNNGMQCLDVGLSIPLDIPTNKFFEKSGISNEESLSLIKNIVSLQSFVKNNESDCLDAENLKKVITNEQKVINEKLFNLNKSIAQKISCDVIMEYVNVLSLLTKEIDETNFEVLLPQYLYFGKVNNGQVVRGIEMVPRFLTKYVEGSNESSSRSTYSIRAYRSLEVRQNGFKNVYLVYNGKVF